MSYSRLLGSRAEEGRVQRHVKPPRCGDASTKSSALIQVRTQAIGAQAEGFNPLRYPSAKMRRNRSRSGHGDLHNSANRVFVGGLSWGSESIRELLRHTNA